MTARQVFEGMLTELSKVKAPSMLLQDFNYFFNKAINQYINKRYNIYDVNQQTTDDLRVLKATAVIKPQEASTYNKHWPQELGTDLTGINAWKTGAAQLFGATYEVFLPLDYLHMLNCICIYELQKRYKCYNKGDNVQFAAKRLTADNWSIILNDFYNRPLPERPYYYVHNINLTNNNPSNPFDNGKDTELDRDTWGTDPKSEDGMPRKLKLTGFTNVENGQPENNLVERLAGVRYGNPTSVRCEIRYGKDSSVFALKAVMIDYIKSPQTIRLTQEQVDLTEDTSQMMEFPDYVCQEIINELVKLVMENTADPRIQTHIPVTTTIAEPAQQQAQAK